MSKSMKPGDEASKDLPSTEPAVSTGNSPDSNLPAAVDHSAELKAMQARLDEAETRHARELAEVRRGQPSPQDLSEHIREQVATAVAAALAGRPTPSVQEDLSKQQMEKIDRERKEREELQNKDLADLEAGPMKFTISMTGEKMMTRTVGGHSPEEAKGKYEKFFGIRAITESTKQIHVSSAG